MAIWKEEDKNLLLSFAAEFDGYMDSSLVEWKSNSSRTLISPGRVLFSAKRMSLFQYDDPELKRTIDTVLERIEGRKISWLQKVEREIPRRLLIWHNAIKEYIEDGVDPSYKAQVVHRVILDLLEKEARTFPTDYQRSLEVLDGNLKGLVSSGEFIWDNSLADIFPRQDYWFLFVELRKGKDHA
jgi:hypothetical protein